MDNRSNSHQHYHTTGTRRIPSWLNAIPSEAGGGSDATSRTGPSIVSHQRQDPPPPYSFQQPQPPEKSTLPPQNKSVSPPRMKVRQHFNPPNQQLYSEPSLASSDTQNQFQSPPKPTTTQPTSTQPTSTQPQSSQQNPSRQPFFSQPHFQQQQRSSPAKSQSVLEPLRQEIIQNFTANCTTCIFSPSSASPTASCGRCQMIKSYVSQSYHTYRFLFSYLLPISEVFNYEEMLAHLNEVIIERVLTAEGKGGGGGKEQKVYPTMDDFGVVVEKAKRRKEFFGGRAVLDGRGGKKGNGRVIGQWGMVRDGTMHVPREEVEQPKESERKRGWNEEGRVIY